MEIFSPRLTSMDKKKKIKSSRVFFALRLKIIFDDSTIIRMEKLFTDVINVCQLALKASIGRTKW